ncbi:hypothetical protein BHM03_00060589, partial [Ensete ventricosum]
PGHCLYIGPHRTICVRLLHLTRPFPLAANKHSPAFVHRTCLCSPTTHPGSFRCSLHKGLSSRSTAVSAPSNCLNARRSAMTNSLVRIGTVEGEWVKCTIAALIRPSSHQLRWRADFQPRSIAYLACPRPTIRSFLPPYPQIWNQVRKTTKKSKKQGIMPFSWQIHPDPDPNPNPNRRAS